MSAAQLLGATLSHSLRAAAEVRWLAVGVVTATGPPLLVDIDGAAVAVGTFAAGTYVAAVDDVVLLGVLRGAPAVSYLLFGKLQEPA